MRRELTFVIGVSLIGIAPGPAVAADNTGSEPKTDSSGISGSPGMIGNNPGPGAVTQSGKPALALSEADRHAIRNAVLGEDTRQGTPGGFSPTVGAKVPSKINIHPLPRPLVYDLPALKEYMYASLERNLLIVDPMEKRVVAVIPLPHHKAAPDDEAGKKQEAVAAVAGLPELKDEQRRAVYAALSESTAGPPPQPVPDAPLLAGTKVPPELTLTPMPPELATRVPQVASLQFAKLQDGRLILIDSGKQEVAGIITADDGRQTVGQEPVANSQEPATAAQGRGGANNAEGRGQAPGASASESVPGGGATGSGGAMSQ